MRCFGVGRMKNGGIKKVFAASLATETNSFSPIYTGLDDFYDAFYAAPGEHPPTPTLCSAPLVAARELAAAGEWQLTEGSCAWAEPGGLVSRFAYEKLRDEILSQLAAAAPVDAALFGLHGAMMAQGCDDCEGDLLSRARDIVGGGAVIAASFDPHSHLSQKRMDAADIAVAFKEFPHTDFMARARDLAALTARQLRGDIRPIAAVFDCRMIDVMPTTAEPMRSFVDNIARIEREDPKTLSISVIHGFLAGDSPDLGAKIIVYADNNENHARQLARRLGMELFSMRGQTRMRSMSPSAALDEAQAAPNGAPTVIADLWDNPGGGVAGDSTVLLKEILRRKVAAAAVATIWDPMAVRHCFAAGEGARIPLRFGGKSGPGTGEPMDAEVEILRLNPETTQPFGGGIVRMGKCAAVRILNGGCGAEVILNSVRAQTFSPLLFSEMGIAAEKKSLLVVKSTNHFRDGFAPLGGKILYADSGTPYPSDPRRAQYKKLRRPIWPIVDNPHEESQE